MLLIKNNPYRTVGLLVGATAREQEKQIRTLKQFIDANQEPQDDFSFPTLGNLHRTLDKVTDAASKLNLDSDKMNAALFWFYKGNSITDEAALDSLKESDQQNSKAIWTKLTGTGEVTQRNSSAFQNLSTLLLCNAFSETSTNSNILEEGISLKLKFLESDFIKDFKSLATDETYKTTKKELQLLFLKQLQAEVEKGSDISSNKFLDIINKQEFIAKEDFLKTFIEKPIEQIEKQIENCKNKRKASKTDTINAGKQLYEQTSENLTQLKVIIGATNLKYSSIADKVANEMLQCSIEYFNYNQETNSDNDYFEPAWQLAKSTEAIAVGKLTKERIVDSLSTLEEMKDKELSKAIALLQSIKDAYQEACKQIDKQVEELEYDTIPWIGGASRKMKKFDVNINWSKVEQMKRDALSWDKVAELIKETIPSRNVLKIEKSNNITKLNEYKALVNFIMSKISNSYKSTITYICYWETKKTTTTTSTPRPITTSAPTTTSDPTTDDGIPYWLKWVGGIVLSIILLKMCN